MTMGTKILQALLVCLCFICFLFLCSENDTLSLASLILLKAMALGILLASASGVARLDKTSQQ